MATQNASTSSQLSDSNESPELNSQKRLRLRALRKGNRSVVTKQQAEIATLISTRLSSFREPDVLSRLDSITQSVASKWDYLTELNKEILELCCMEDLEREIEESSEWDTRITEARQKIEYFKRGSYGAVPASNRNSRQTRSSIVNTNEG